MAPHQLTSYPSAGSQIAFARVATALAVMSVGALAIVSGRIDRLSIDELDVNRLRVRELITERDPS